MLDRTSALAKLADAVLVLLGVLGGASCGAPAAAPATAPAAPLTRGWSAPPRPVVGSIAGHYWAPHGIAVVCDLADGWCDEDVEDKLTVRDAGAGRIAVAIELTQTNAHTCDFEGVLEPDPRPAPDVPARRWTFVALPEDDADDADGEGPCSLVLEHAHDELRLEASGCRTYCGARASLDAVFPVPSARPRAAR